MTRLIILGRVTSINVRKVLWTADEVGLDYDREDWGLPVRDPSEPAFLRLNPNAQVPVIVEDEFVLWESNAIMRYLAHRHRSGLLPPGIREQALVEQWLGWQATDLNGQWGYAINALLRRTPGYDDAGRIADSIGRWTAKMKILEDRLAASDSGHVAGETFSIADIAIALSVHRWMLTPFDHSSLPAVARYYEKMRERPAAAKYLAKETP